MTRIEHRSRARRGRSRLPRWSRPLGLLCFGACDRQRPSRRRRSARRSARRRLPVRRTGRTTPARRSAASPASRWSPTATERRSRRARTAPWSPGRSISRSRRSREANFFGDFYESNQFGMAPTARISVIKRKDERNYKLKSPEPRGRPELGPRHPPDLHPHRPAEDPQGRVPRADDPDLGAVVRGRPEQRQQPVALEPRCRPVRRHGPEQIKNGKPQQKVGSSRQYGCDYKGARLLYWGYYVPR